MAKLKQNLIANSLGQGWSALMGLAFVPFYLRYLGMEAYGLIGLFAVIQAWLTILDMGMTPTLNREMARFTAGGHDSQSIQDLLRSVEVLCFGLAAVMGFGIWVTSGYVANDWLKAKTIPISVIRHAVSVMAFVVATRFVEGIYRGSLFGLQRQVWFNGANAAFSTLRWAGAVGVLAFISPTIVAFFLWQGFCSLLSVVIFALSVHRALPRPARPATFSLQAVRDVRKFAGGMVGITALSLLLTQVDKVMLSRLLTLDAFGYYTLASTLAGTLYIVVSPITTALYPRMVELVTVQDDAGLIAIYHKGAQLVTVLTAPAAMLLSLFAGGIIFLWTGNQSHAAHAAPVLSAIVLGSFLNTMMWVPYQCQLAHGWTSLANRINLIGVAVLMPALFWITPRYGAVGAAWLWAGLNFSYVLVGMQFTHRHLLPTEKWRWYFNDFLLPLGGAAGVALAALSIEPASQASRFQWFVFLAVTGAISLTAAAALSTDMRMRALSLVANRSGCSLFDRR